MPIRSGEREDYMLRVIRQAGESLRLLRQRLAGGATAPAVVRGQALAAIDGLLGADAPLLARIDARSAVTLVGDPRRVALWHGLLDVAAAGAEAQGDTGDAASLRARARSLATAAAGQWPEVADATAPDSSPAAASGPDAHAPVDARPA